MNPHDELAFHAPIFEEGMGGADGFNRKRAYHLDVGWMKGFMFKHSRDFFEMAKVNSPIGVVGGS